MTESILQKFPLQLIFRGTFPGVFFVLSFLVANKGWKHATEQVKSEVWWWLIAASVFSGVVAYTFHRSAVYPLLEGIMNATQNYRMKATGYCSVVRLISKRTCKQLVDYWTVGASDEKEESKPDAIVSRHITVWHDYLQLQYASSLCIWLGAIFGTQLLDENITWQWDCTLILIAVVLFLSALLGDLRRRTFVSYLLERKEGTGVVSRGDV